MAMCCLLPGSATWKLTNDTCQGHKAPNNCPFYPCFGEVLQVYIFQSYFLEADQAAWPDHVHAEPSLFSKLRQGDRWSDDLSSTEAHFENRFFWSNRKLLTFLCQILIQTM